MATTACTAVPYGDEGVVVPPDAFQADRNDVVDPIIPHPDTACDAIAAAPATTSETYVGNDGIRFTFPYNPAWTEGEQPFAPYTEGVGADGEDIVSFGTPTVDLLGTTCDWVHAYQLTVLPPQSSDGVVRRIRNEGGETGIVPDVKVETINGLTVVRYSPPGLCAYPTLEVIGTTHNYSVSTGCGKGTDEEWKYLEEVVKTMQLPK